MKKLNSNHVKQLAFDLAKTVKDAASKKDALNRVSETIKEQLGDMPGPEILLVPNEISFHFIELLDQVVFELSETIPAENTVNDYIINDLYLRLSIYLDLFNDIELYKKNLANRIITYEDTLIIKNYSLSEYINLLISEFYEQPGLQKWILRVLLSFNSENLLQFYYMVCTEKNCLEVKVLALAGLKSQPESFTNWDILAHDIDLPSDIISYIRTFNTISPEMNGIPTDTKSLLFFLVFIEYNSGKISTMDWLITSLKPLLESDPDNSLSPGIHISLTNTILHLDPDILSSLNHNDDQLKTFLQILDILPQTYFQKIMIKLTSLENNLIINAKSLINSNQVPFDENNSNLINLFLNDTINI